MSTLWDRICSSVSVEVFGSIVDEMKHTRHECNGQVTVNLESLLSDWTM